MSDNQSHAWTLASFPVEILQIITSYLSAQDILVQLLNCGNRTLERKLKQGGVTLLAISSLKDCGMDTKVIGEFSSLLAAHLAIQDSDAHQTKAIVDYLPKSLRTLHVKSQWAKRILVDFSIAKVGVSEPFGDYEDHVPSIAERFPHLTSLRLDCTSRNDVIDDLSDDSKKDFIDSLPPSLTHLHLNRTETWSFKLLKRLPPQLQELEGPAITMQSRGPLAEPLPFLRSVHLSYQNEKVRNPAGPNGSSPQVPTVDYVHTLLSTIFPALQTLHLDTTHPQLYDLRFMHSLTKLKLELIQSTPLQTVFAMLPPTLTDLSFINSQLHLQASDAELPRLLSITNLHLDPQTRIESSEPEIAPLSILLAICPNITSLSSHFRFSRGDSLSPWKALPKGLGTSLKYLDTTFEPSAPLLADLPRIESVTSRVTYEAQLRRRRLNRKRPIPQAGEEEQHHVYLHNVVSKLPPSVRTLQIDDLRLSDQVITNFQDALFAAQNDTSAQPPLLPDNWTFDQTESLHIDAPHFRLEQQGEINKSHPFSNVLLHPSQSSSRSITITHVPTLLLLLPRTLTALETGFDFYISDASTSVLFSPTAFPCLKSLKTPTLMDLRQWTALESLEVDGIFYPSTAFGRAIPQSANGALMGSHWGTRLPPNLTFLAVPTDATSGPLTHLTRLTSVNMRNKAFSYLPTHLPPTITALEGLFSQVNDNVTKFINGLPLLKSIKMTNSPLNDTMLDHFFLNHGHKFQLIDGCLRIVSNIEQLLQRVPQPPPPMCSSNVAEYFATVALSSYPLWKTSVKPIWRDKIDFSESLESWELFASWFSNASDSSKSITSFDLSDIILPTRFGASMPSNTIELITHRDSFATVDYSDESDFDDDSGDEDNSSDEESDRGGIAKPLLDLSLLPSNLKTLCTDANEISPTDWETLPKTLTKLIVNISSAAQFEALVTAQLPSSLTQLHVNAMKAPDMSLLARLPPSIERLSIALKQRSTFTDGNSPLQFLPATVNHLRLSTLEGLRPRLVQSSIDQLIARNPSLVISFFDLCQLRAAWHHRRRELKRQAVGRNPEKKRNVARDRH